MAWPPALIAGAPSTHVALAEDPLIGERAAPEHNEVAPSTKVTVPVGVPEVPETVAV